MALAALYLAASAKSPRILQEARQQQRQSELRLVTQNVLLLLLLLLKSLLVLCQCLQWTCVLFQPAPTTIRIASVKAGDWPASRFIIIQVAESIVN